jgi:hypothetical protein
MIPEIASAVMITAITSAVIAISSIVLILALHSISASLLRIFTLLVTYGIEQERRQYVRGWFTSWDHEARSELKSAGHSRIYSEFYLLTRVATLPVQFGVIRDSSRTAVQAPTPAWSLPLRLTSGDHVLLVAGNMRDSHAEAQVAFLDKVYRRVFRARSQNLTAGDFWENYRDLLHAAKKHGRPVRGRRPRSGSWLSALLPRRRAS